MSFGKHQLAPTVSEIAQNNEGKLNVVKIDVDANRDLAVKYGIRSIPTLMIFKDGEAVATEIGALSKQQLEEFVLQVL